MIFIFSSNTRKLNRVVPKVNINNLTNNDLTGSLQNIEIPTNTKFQSKTRSNPNPIKLVNNKTKISEFYQEILENSARYNQRIIDEFDNNTNTLTIYNVTLDYGTEGASPNNFEVLYKHMAGSGAFPNATKNNDNKQNNKKQLMLIMLIIILRRIHIRTLRLRL